MKNLKNILTKINFAFGIEVQGPCCKAVNFDSFDSGSLQELRYFYQQYENDHSMARPDNDYKPFYSRAKLLLQEGLTDFLNNFCDCKNTSRISIDTEVMPTPTSSPGSYGVSEKSKENSCASLLFSESFYESIQRIISDQFPDPLQSSIMHSRNSFGRVLQLLIDIVKNAAKNNPLANHPRTDNIDNFLNDWCNASLQYRSDTLGQLSINKQLTEIIATSWGEINIGISEAPQVSGEMCLPVLDPDTEASLNQYGVSSNILTACAVAAGFGGAALGIRTLCRIFRGANKTQKTAAIAACVAAAASQTGSAAVNANDPVLKSIIDNYLEKACAEDGEGGLFQCEESTQGGGDGGGGPVDPPGGGEVGEMGGNFL